MRALLASLLLVTTLAADAGNRLQTRYYRAPWTPNSATLENSATLAAWWSAADYLYMVDDGSGVISNWKDRVTQFGVNATTTARPTWSATSFNSAYPGMTFDGVANAMTVSSTTPLPTGSTAGEIWVVASATNDGVITTHVAYGSQGTALLRAIRKNSGAQAAIITDNTSSLTGQTSAVGAHIIGGNWSGTTQNGFQDGVAFTGNPGTLANTLNTATTRLRIGSMASASASSFFNGVIADVIVINGLLSTADRQRLEGYLAWRYALQANLPTTHPYRWAPP